MAFTNDLDPVTPDDTEDASLGAGRIRETKLALIERFLTIFRNFPDEDPAYAGSEILVPIAGAEVGVESARPAAPDRQGHIWISSDTLSMYIGTAALTWLTLLEQSAAGHARVRIVTNSTQALPSATPTVVEWPDNGIEYEVGEWHDYPGSFGTDFTVPEDGFYQIHARAKITTSGTHTVRTTVGIRVNAVEVTDGSDFTDGTNETLRPQASIMMPLSLGDVVTVVATQVGTGSENIAAGTSIEIVRLF